MPIYASTNISRFIGAKHLQNKLTWNNFYFSRIMGWSGAGRHSKRKDAITSILLCFGGGVLLSTSMIHMLPEVYCDWIHYNFHYHYTWIQWIQKYLSRFWCFRYGKELRIQATKMYTAIKSITKQRFLMPKLRFVVGFFSFTSLKNWY